MSMCIDGKCEGCFALEEIQTSLQVKLIYTMIKVGDGLAYHKGILIYTIIG